MENVTLDKAIEKIQKEAEKKLSNKPIQSIAEFLIDTITAHPGEAGKILEEKKTLDGAMNHMREAARKADTGGFACFTDAEGFKLVAQYFKLDLTGTTAEPAPANTVKLPPDLPKELVKTASNVPYIKPLSFDLDSFLGSK